MADAYARLRRIAARLRANERLGHTLSATDILHEALARLLNGGGPAGGSLPREGPAFVEFVGRAARAMSQVLVDYARRRGATKRGGGRRRVDLDDVEASVESASSDWLALDEALEDMRRNDPRRHSVVVLRFFAGLDNRQIARELAVDERTVGRDWAAARLWLKKRLAGGSSAGADPESAGARPDPDERSPGGNREL